MAQQSSTPLQSAQKRKQHPSNPHDEPNKRARPDHRAKSRDARTIATQTTSTALKNGALDVDSFVKAREYEIRALEEGISRSKKALTQRAFQQVPKELRRRTASHNFKRVPKRLQERAKREMVVDNTPTVTASKRKPTRHMRLRIATAKKLRALGAQDRPSRKVSAPTLLAESLQSDQEAPSQDCQNIRTRAPKVKQVSSATPPVPKAKYRKRQINKTWLPTHMYHAKRARMTPPTEPLWKFAIPLTPTVKSYRPTHRAANDRGAVAWDTSYLSTISLQGQQRSIESLLKALGVGNVERENLWGRKGEKWRNGSRVWQGLVFMRKDSCQPIAPVTLIWCVDPSRQSSRQNEDPAKHKRTLFIRVHPSAFSQLWDECICLSKVAQPSVNVEDLRFEIGSIELRGPAATEALQGALWPSPRPDGLQHAASSVEKTWTALAGLSSQASLPTNSMLSFYIQDPRLHHPPRTIISSDTHLDQSDIAELLASWPIDSLNEPPAIFDRRARLSASRALSSQKAINRRKSLTTPGQYPEVSAEDPRIPVLLYQTNFGRKEVPWTLLLPWKCVQPVWYSMMYYPISTGGQPRFGGLDEKRQLAFEAGQPWFPGDYPGTQAGWIWELETRAKRRSEWERHPKSKRINWESIRLGHERTGEVGLGWACDWERLLNALPQDAVGNATGDRVDDGLPANTAVPVSQLSRLPFTVTNSKPASLTHVTADEAQALLLPESTIARSPGTLVIVRLKLLSRGVPQECARIYRLPFEASDSLRKRWLDLHPHNQARNKPKGHKNSLPRVRSGAPTHVIRQHLAKSLLTPPRAGTKEYPVCPPEDDLIGFVTSGNYNLGEGQGSGIGSIMIFKVLNEARRDPDCGTLCIVRNAGNGVGWLAKWEVV